MPDYIVYKNDTIATYNLLVEQYLQKRDTAAVGQLFGLSFRNATSFNCWRGYQAIYTIKNDSLFLTDIINCGTIRMTKDQAFSEKTMKDFFGEKVVNGKVYIDWFSGDLNFPLKSKPLRWDGVFYWSYERETVITIANGKVLRINEVDNYVDSPKGIDRRYQAKTSDVLFKALKKVKWKKDCECGDGDPYLITIGNNGTISKVAFAKYQTDEEIDKYWEREDYDYCINTITHALKGLKFDIIKDKGKPISEDVYLEIWLNDDGKLENWTN